jgi:hypothetical protein
MNPNIAAQPGELRATIHVTRAATGKVETFQLIGHSDPEKLKEIMRNHRHHGTAGGLVGEIGGVNKPTN